MSIVMSLLVFTACSDDSVNDFSPVPYPDEMEQEEPTPDPTPDPDDPTPAPDADPVWKVTSMTTVFNSKVCLRWQLQKPVRYLFFVKLVMVLGWINRDVRIFL